MQFEITEVAKRVLLEGFPADVPESGSPIDNGRLRFDSLRVEAVDDAIGGYRLVLALHGRDVATSRIGEFAPEAEKVQAEIDAEVRHRNAMWAPIQAIIDEARKALDEADPMGMGQSV